MNQPPPKDIHNDAAKVRLCANIVSAFAEKYGDKIPDGCGSLSVSYDTHALLSLRTGKTDEDRERALTLYGELFGREGWEMELNYNSTAFNWSRTIDGVKCVIYEAETVTIQRNRVPVPPSKFPIQIEDAK